MTSKSSMASISHVRTHSADMYDITTNRSVGSQKIFEYDVNYHAGACRWYVDLTITAPMAFKAG